MIDDNSKEFIKRHIGPSDKDQLKMLDYVGYKSLEDLMINTVPDKILLKEDLKIDEPLSENDALKKLKSISKQNKIYKNFIGMGYYNSITPNVILRNILENKLRITSCPKIILTHPTESSGQDAGIDKNIFARAAIFYKFYGYVSYVKLIHHIFLLKRKNMIYYNEIISKFMVGLKGIKKFKSLK